MPSALSALWTPAPRAESPFKGDSLRRLVSRRYELRLVERGLAARPHAVAADSAEEDGDSPLVERFEAPSPKLLEEIDDWLARVVLVDGERQFRATELGRSFANAWRRAGGEPPLPALRPRLSLVPSSSVEDTARAGFPRLPPLAGPVRAVSPATDETKGGEEMGLTEYQQKIIDTASLDATDAATKLGTSRNAVYTARAALRKQGKLGAAEGGGRASRPAKATKVVRASKTQELVATVEHTADELIAPLRAALEQLDVKRARIVAGIEALGGSAE